MVIYGSDTHDDAYILPYRTAKHLFTQETLEVDRDRWMGTITDGSIHITPGAHSMDVTRFHNAIELLDTGIPVCADLPESLDLPSRVPTTISRILRDTVLVAALKKKYNFCCQLCGTQLELPDGFFYCEAHHIRPLGTPHNGPDAASNLVIVCPNHHVLLDYGAIPLSADSFCSSLHPINQAHINYHNANIHNVT
jgi:hypothetical protein